LIDVFTHFIIKINAQKDKKTAMVKLQKRGAASDDFELGIYCQGRGPE